MPELDRPASTTIWQMMSIRQSIARGAAWTVLYKWVDRGLGFVSTLILAHLLVPADFGLVQMGTSIIALLLTLTYFGLDTALLRQKETTEQSLQCCLDA